MSAKTSMKGRGYAIIGSDLNRALDHEGRARSAEALVEQNPCTHFGLDVHPFAENSIALVCIEGLQHGIIST
jgi:hypothetical protein